MIKEFSNQSGWNQNHCKIGFQVAMVNAKKYKQLGEQNIAPFMEFENYLKCRQYRNASAFELLILKNNTQITYVKIPTDPNWHNEIELGEAPTIDLAKGEIVSLRDAALNSCEHNIVENMGMMAVLAEVKQSSSKELKATGAKVYFYFGAENEHKTSYTMKLLSAIDLDPLRPNECYSHLYLNTKLKCLMVFGQIKKGDNFSLTIKRYTIDFSVSDGKRGIVKSMESKLVVNVEYPIDKIEPVSMNDKKSFNIELANKYMSVEYSYLFLIVKGSSHLLAMKLRKVSPHNPSGITLVKRPKLEFGNVEDYKQPDDKNARILFHSVGIKDDELTQRDSGSDITALVIFNRGKVCELQIDKFDDLNRPKDQWIPN